eukprot:CAMPEP_0168332720 /NCGR_PEP_ID=MMETSP0213-20121227/9128_1 /TAXON_ID=151035 /ORGANISM="Euplotes harpa, Strain FSP1.4" /LENGTH=80 /DNA_ID=CAMNT_0008336803 /DNA_START=53 /DNA_END=295 /DNA_ORIENTATION=-
MYTFEKSMHKSVHSTIIDDEWRKEKFQDLDIVLPPEISKNFQLQGIDADAQSRLPLSETKEWNDLSLDELINQFTDSHDK